MMLAAKWAKVGMVATSWCPHKPLSQGGSGALTSNILGAPCRAVAVPRTLYLDAIRLQQRLLMILNVHLIWRVGFDRFEII